MELLCQFIAAKEPDVVQRRGLFALSALMRGKTHPQLTFLEQCQGLSQLGKDFHERSPLTQLKAVTLLTDLLHEQVGTAVIVECQLVSVSLLSLVFSASSTHMPTCTCSSSPSPLFSVTCFMSPVS